MILMGTVAMALRHHLRQLHTMGEDIMEVPDITGTVTTIGANVRG
jgi:hypothetical protein